MSRTLWSCLGLFWLAGCASVPTTVEVKVPVPVPCLSQTPAKPALPADALTGSEDLFTLGQTLWADRLARKAYELELEAALSGCLKLPGIPRPPPA